MIAEFIAALMDPVETGEDIDARAAMIAHAVQALDAPGAWPYGVASWRALVARTWYEEGARFAADVHAGTKRGDNGRAACFGQVWAHGVFLPRADWVRTMGVDQESTDACARATSIYLTIGAARCITTPGSVSRTHARTVSELENTARVVMLYGTGKRCTPGAWAYRRAAGAARWRTIFDTNHTGVGIPDSISLG